MQSPAQQPSEPSCRRWARERAAVSCVVGILLMGFISVEPTQFTLELRHPTSTGQVGPMCSQPVSSMQTVCLPPGQAVDFAASKVNEVFRTGLPLGSHIVPSKAGLNCADVALIAAPNHKYVFPFHLSYQCLSPGYVKVQVTLDPK